MRRTLLGVLVSVCLAATTACGGGGDGDEPIATDTSTPTPAEAPAAEVEPTCEEIERFAGSLVDVGITYDYEASRSPSEAAADADLVIAGQLTGAVAERGIGHGYEEPGDAQVFAGYEVEVVEDLAPTARWVTGAKVDVLVAHNPAHRPDIARVQDAATPGTPVVVIAHEHAESGELIASIEGFVTSCDDGPLLGWTGHLGTWSQLATLEDLAEALRSPEEVEPCGSEPGSPTDLSAEPERWEDFGGYERWQDLAGCDVRIDVVSHTYGPQHCGWESAEFVSIGDPIGASIDVPRVDDRVRTYVWDPEGVFASVDDAYRAMTLRIDELPKTAVDTGYRQGTAQLWLDPAEVDHLYRVEGGSAQRFVLDAERRLLCA